MISETKEHMQTSIEAISPGAVSEHAAFIQRQLTALPRVQRKLENQLQQPGLIKRDKRALRSALRHLEWCYDLMLIAAELNSLPIPSSAPEAQPNPMHPTPHNHRPPFLDAPAAPSHHSHDTLNANNTPK